MQFVSTLYGFLHELHEHEVALHDIEKKIIRPSILPLHRLQPTLHLLSRMQLFLQKLLHAHERDTFRLVRANWQARHSHLPTRLDPQWCSLCHASPCIYE